MCTCMALQLYSWHDYSLYACQFNLRYAQYSLAMQNSFMSCPFLTIPVITGTTQGTEGIHILRYAVFTRQHKIDRLWPCITMHNQVNPIICMYTIVKRWPAHSIQPGHIKDGQAGWHRAMSPGAGWQAGSEAGAPCLRMCPYKHSSLLGFEFDCGLCTNDLISAGLCAIHALHEWFA